MARKRNAIGIGIAIALGVFAVRASLLYANTRQLVQASDQFPRDYTVGTDKTQPQIRYLALGDSTVQGAGVSQLNETIPYLVAQEIAARGYRVKVINRGVVGAKIADVEADQLDQLTTLRPDIITLNIGSNDATHFSNYFSYSHDMLTVLQVLTKSPKTLVIVAGTPNLSLVPAMQPGLSAIVDWRAHEQNRILTNLITGSPIKLVDLYNDGKLSGMENYATDQFHPSAQGYAKWGQLYAPIIKWLKFP
jgi:lysophospholipase L1-like esterase